MCTTTNYCSIYDVKKVSLRPRKRHSSSLFLPVRTWMLVSKVGKKKNLTQYLNAYQNIQALAKLQCNSLSHGSKTQFHVQKMSFPGYEVNPRRILCTSNSPRFTYANYSQSAAWGVLNQSSLPVCFILTFRCGWLRLIILTGQNPNWIFFLNTDRNF